VNKKETLRITIPLAAKPRNILYGGFLFTPTFAIFTPIFLK